MNKNLTDFINALRDEATFNVHGPNLALLDAGNFEGLVQYAKQVGYDFAKEDVQAFLTSESDGGLAGMLTGEPNALLKKWIASVHPVESGAKT